MIKEKTVTETKTKTPKEPKNVDVSMDGNIMTLKIDTTKNFGLSKSGKTTIVASTAGEHKFNDLCVNLNVYTR